MTRAVRTGSTGTGSCCPAVTPRSSSIRCCTSRDTGSRSTTCWPSVSGNRSRRAIPPGIEVTTGPLGQGIANAVGLAMAEANLRARFGEDVADHYTYCLASDGDLMEGVSHEACSLAGHLGLGRLIVVYDDNHITIDGPTELTMTDDAAMRFRSYGWDVDEVGEVAEDLDALEAALARARSVTDRPTLIRLRSHIGVPSPKHTDTPFAHGGPFGADEIAATKAVMGLSAEAFHVPEAVLEFYREAGRRHSPQVDAWEDRFAARAKTDAELAACVEGRGLPGWTAALPSWAPGASVATRVASADCLNALVPFVPSLIAGGADLTGNTGVMLKDQPALSRSNPGGRLIHYGVREHGMGAVMTGMAMHGGVFPVGGTFFVFSDYMRGAVRVAAISGARVVYSWTHDSIGVGEDGPTHQPIEQLMSLRAMPALCLMRPADANEVAAAWTAIVAGDGGPVGLVLSRQALPVLPRRRGARARRVRPRRS
jgi:transketolase